MIPAKLRLRNFMCYRDDVPPLLLEGVHVACLCGENGAGKSALLDAITWALWGKAFRARSDDDLIHMGRDEMEVELEFLVLENLYRVLRKRERGPNRRAGRSILELHLSTGNGFLPVTANTLRETQHKINQILHMDFDTFVNSAFLVQGRADEFTIKSPDKRKEVLAEILNLGYYDSLEERAREEARRCRESRRGLELAIEEVGQELARREEYQTRLQEVEALLAERQGLLQSHEAEAQRLRMAKQGLEHQQAQLAEVQQRLLQREADLGRLSQRAESIQKEIAQDEAVIGEAEEITLTYQRFQSAAARKEELDTKASEYLDLSQRKADLERAVERARAELEKEHGVLLSKVQGLQSRAQGLEQSSAQLAQEEKAVKALEETEEQAAAARAELQRLVAETASHKATNEGLHQEMDDIKARMEQLERGQGVCPLCGTELGEDRCENVLADYQAKGKAKGDAYRQNETQTAGLQERERRLQEELAGLEGHLRTEQAPLQAKVGALRHAMEQASQAAGEMPEATASLAQLERRLEGQDFAPDAQKSLPEVLAGLGQLGYDQAAHGAVRQEYEALRPIEARHRLLEEAQRRLPEERERLGEVQKEVQEREGEAAADRRRAEELTGELEALPRLTQELAMQEQAAHTLSAEVDRLRQEQGAAQRDLTRLAEMERGLEEKRAALAQTAEEQSLYEELSLAFGRRGIQALIIESALPEIEEEANNLLGRMTDNRMHLKLETQAALRTREGVQETLEIRISDELGTRGYETFSGGEAYRINLALRIALSRLLARRAGAPLPTLFIDEGFGTQDVIGRDKVVEAIRGIQDEFERIIVITHIEELKEQFPVRIEVQKTVEGSTFWLS